MSASPIALLARLWGMVSSARVSPPSSGAQIALSLDRLQADFAAKVDALVAGMNNGTITIGQFAGAMPSLIRQQHLAASVIASGGIDAATPETRALAQSAIDSQLVYFERWKQELLQQAATGKLPSPAYIANRAKLYGRAATETASRALVQAHGLPEMPFYPGQKTQCHSFCRCVWVIRTLDVVNGNYDCSYEIDELAEHCLTCLARSRVAHPLRVRHGVIVDPERYRAANLYA